MLDGPHVIYLSVYCYMSYSIDLVIVSRSCIIHFETLGLNLSWDQLWWVLSFCFSQQCWISILNIPDTSDPPVRQHTILKTDFFSLQLFNFWVHVAWEYVEQNRYITVLCILVVFSDHVHVFETHHSFLYFILVTPYVAFCPGFCTDQALLFPDYEDFQGFPSEFIDQTYQFIWLIQIWDFRILIFWPMGILEYNVGTNRKSWENLRIIFLW